jgi:hypothetical protein
VSILWYCEKTAIGHTLIADVGGWRIAHDLIASDMKTAHEPAWLFWNAIRGLTRNAENWSASQ